MNPKQCCQEIYFLLFFLLTSPFAAAQTLVADSTARVVVGDITVEGNHRTRTGIIMREMAIRSGDTLSAELLKEKLEIDRRKVINTNLFITVDLLTRANSDSIHTDIRIVVKERWYFIMLPVFQLADRNFNEWWYERKRIFLRIDFFFQAGSQFGNAFIQPIAPDLVISPFYPHIVFERFGEMLLFDHCIRQLRKIY